MAKLRILTLLCAAMLLAGCTSNQEPGGTASTSAAVRPADVGQAAGQDAESAVSGAGEDAGQFPLDDTAFIGEYLDSDGDEPNLEIAKGDDGTYIVQIGIFRLATLSDGIGELTADGMEFTATDPSGDPIRGVITVEDQSAVVTFTESTWEFIETGAVFSYTKSSDRPNIWSAAAG